MRRKRSRAEKLEKEKKFGENLISDEGNEGQQESEREKEEARETMMRWGGREKRNRRGEDWRMLKEEKDVTHLVRV